MTNGACLSGSTTTGNTNGNIDAIGHLNGVKRGQNHFSLLIRLAVIGDVSVINDKITGTFLDSNSCSAGLSATGCEMGGGFGLSTHDFKND